MQKIRRKWTREELIITFNLYCKIEFSKINYKHPSIIFLSELLKRTPSAVAWKLVNFASLDAELTKRGIRGAVNCSKLDREIFHEFTTNWETLVEESEKLLQKFKINTEILKEETIESKEGKDILRFVKTRSNQTFFRESVLSSYSSTCCLTGINIPQLLIASHIIPWSEDKANRLNPQNGLCLNSLHDKAFDKGFISFDENYRLILSSELRKKKNKYFLELEGKKMTLPKKFLPNLDFLKYHNERIFRG
jgi:putative restriction endonuclease